MEERWNRSRGWSSGWWWSGGGSGGGGSGGGWVGTRDALASGPLFLLSVCSSSGCVRCCCCFFSLLRVLVWVCFLLRARRSWGMVGIGGRVQVLLVPL